MTADPPVVEHVDPHTHDAGGAADPVAGGPDRAGGGCPPGPRWRARIVLGLGCAWLLYVGVHLLLSGRWWVWAILDLVPPQTFVVVPLLVAALTPFAAPLRRWVGATAAAALLVGVGLAGFNVGLLSGGGDGPAPPGAIRVLSWNTGVWDDNDDPAAFYAFLRAQDADVYLLQEYEPFEAAGDQARLRRELPGYTLVSRGELMTLSRLPVVGQAALPAELPAGTDPHVVYERIKALRTDVRVGDRTLSVYNVHIPIQIGLGPSAFSTATRDRFDNRRAQYAGLRRDVSANPNPLLVSGDFNTGPSMGELRWLRGHLIDAIRADGALYPTTWPTGVPVLPRLWRLDWAFTNDPVGVHEYTRLDSGGMSDHRATRLVLSVGGD